MAMLNNQRVSVFCFLCQNDYRFTNATSDIQLHKTCDLGYLDIRPESFGSVDRPKILDDIHGKPLHSMDYPLVNVYITMENRHC